MAGIAKTVGNGGLSRKGGGPCGLWTVHGRPGLRGAERILPSDSRSGTDGPSSRRGQEDEARVHDTSQLAPFVEASRRVRG